MSESGQAVESLDAIEARASEFLLRRRLSRWTDAEREELEAWLNEATSHRVAFLRFEEGEALVERVAGGRPAELDRLFVRRRRYVMPLLAMAASLVVVAVLGFIAESYFRSPPDRTYSTDVGGRTLLSFADGTQIELNTDSAVRFRMTGEERTVWLEKGEAWFHVSHDAARPFAVVVGRHRVTDLGTEFFVRRAPDGAADRMEVALLNGRATLSTQGAQSALLMPGDDAIATPVSMSVTRKTLQELADELSWRQGVLVFRNTRLADAVREFNRYNETKLVIADPSIADVKVSAEVKTENFEGFLRLAQTVLNLHLQREGNDILISRSKSHKADGAL